MVLWLGWVHKNLHVKWMKKFGHNVDEEEDGGIEYEESGEYSVEEDDI